MKRIYIKLIEENEHETLYQLVNQNKANLIRYFPITVKKNETIEATKAYLKGFKERIANKEIYPFGIYDQEMLIGILYIKAIEWKIAKCELGYFLHQAYQGKGITSKAVEEGLKFCFEKLNMNKVYLRIDPVNTASIKIAEKNGFTKEGLLRQEFKIETGELVDVLYYGKLRDD